MRNLYKVCIILFVIIYSINLQAQNNLSDDILFYKKTDLIKVQSKYYIGNYSVFVGSGTIAQIGCSYRKDNLYLAIRQYININLWGMLVGADYINIDNSLLIGLAFPQKYIFNIDGYWTISSGISYDYLTRPSKQLGYEYYENKTTENFGIPLDLSNTFRFGIFAISTNITLTYVFGQNEVIGGLFTNIHLGDFRDKYKIRKRELLNASRAEIAKSINEDHKIKGYTYNYNHSIEFSIPKNYFRIQHTTYDFLPNTDLLIPIQFAKALGDDRYLNDFNSYFEISTQLRKWINDKNTYWISIGPKYVYLDSEKYGEENILFLSGSLGLYYNFYKRVFISSKVNVATPLSNQDKFETIFDGKEANGKYHRVNIELINLGITF